MNGEKKGKEFIQQVNEIKVDYENIDVADIMAQIKRKIASQPKKELEQEIDREELQFSSGLYTPEPSEGYGIKLKIKRILLKIMRPISPLIKLLILPVHEEVKLNLDHTNKRIDNLTNQFGAELRNLNEALNQRIDLVNQALNQRIDLAFSELEKAKEYTKLLHNLSHNIVVELTKLKIEQENLKLKVRIMEKDFEFLDKKEKQLEKDAFK